MADFPIIFLVWGTVAEEGLAERFRAWPLGRTCFPEIAGTTGSSQRFSPKASRLHVRLSVQI
jgi:hypothetical protein